MAHVLQFVNAITSTPTVRLDLNLAPFRTMSSTDFGFPELRHAMATTLLSDGVQVPASAYGPRILQLRLQIQTATVDLTATEIQRLVRELNRPVNILRTALDMGGTSPVFFKTFRSSPASWQIHTTGEFIDIAADVLAEPFAYGLQETPVSLQTLNTDPAGAGNPSYFDVTSVKGDVEAPAYIRYPTGVGNFTTMFAVRRRGTPSSSPFLFQAEAMTQGTNTTTQVNDANFSGTGNNYSRCTFTTATMATRLSFADLGTSGVDLRGRYRVMLRYRKNTSTDDINIQLQYVDQSTVLTITNDAVTLPDTTNITYADLGEFSFPLGLDPVTDPTGAEISVRDAGAELRIQAERTAGAGTLDFDFILLVPADDRLAFIERDGNSFTSYLILDARDNSVHARDTGDLVVSSPMVALAGGLPMLSPSQTNRVYMQESVGSGDLTALGNVTNVSISYWPRYLSVRPMAS